MIYQLCITKDEYADFCTDQNNEICTHIPYIYDSEKHLHTIYCAIFKKYFPAECMEKVERKSKRKLAKEEQIVFTSKSFYEYFSSIVEKALEAKREDGSLAAPSYSITLDMRQAKCLATFVF